MHDQFIDDDRARQEQERDMKLMAHVAEEALARCVGVAMTVEEVECILCLAGLNLPKSERKDGNGTV